MACAECEGGRDEAAGNRCPACGDTAPHPAAPAASAAPAGKAAPAGRSAPAGQPWWVLSDEELRTVERVRREQGESPYLRWQSTRTLATVTVALLGVVVASDLFAILAGSRFAGLLEQEARSSWYGSGGALESAESLYSAAGVVQLAALVAAGIPFLMWFHRSRLNAQTFDAASQRMGAGWAVGGWFVPVVNLWFPKKIANDIWDASTPPGPDGTVRERLPGGLLNCWWLLWLLTCVIGGIAAEGYEDAWSLGEIEGAVSFYLFADGVDILAAVLAILVVHRVTAMQHALQEHRAALAAAPV
ncbi:DUF4328 domain-containing protein [Streptomyces verrucosisporus]|uniref:DUF4328 domain-containing protein n=1 Tax=Streptomyces verrucosisporus TaxID=1695161 RepID=UPI0019CFB1EA|nr:DUF4328 domain-containing protein [Streptomyces verrucosisporus]MBN3932583.1 DUF4328 domain-containing protein [Streptomyces verrucosisporus]